MTVDPFWGLKTRLNVRGKVRAMLPAVDLLTAVPTALAAVYFYALKRLGLAEMPLNKGALEKIGIWPVRRHYYEPYFDKAMLRRPLDQPRDLPGLELGTERSLELMSSLAAFRDEPLTCEPRGGRQYTPDNGTYGLPDAALLYAMIRHFRPKRLIEVGSGNSTLVAMQAIAVNRAAGHECEHLCIEPYEMPWLEAAGAQVQRSLVEDVDLTTFDALGENDILFIDNSHMIRPQGDVLTVVQSILPRLALGVIVHIHDLFTPRDYPDSWLLDHRSMWNEQYLVETFLTLNSEFETLAAANHLFLDHRPAYDRMRTELSGPQGHPPAGYWLRRRPRGRD